MKMPAHIAAAINRVAGRDVEITIRGERSFTFSFDAIDERAKDRIMGYLHGHGSLVAVEDQECGTFIYLDVR